MKYYVVFKGFNPGVYDDWEEVKLQTTGFPGATFKSFATSEEATEAYRNYSGVEDRNELFRILAATSPKKNAEGLPSISENPEIDTDAWAVDASCMGNPGKMEYRGVNLKTGEVIFHSGPYDDATNNIGEYLAIVHAMALMAQKGEYHNIYSDSRIAMGWVRKKKHNSKVPLTEKNGRVMELLGRADLWLQTHRFPGVLRKWETERWGEIPADFGRK